MFKVLTKVTEEKLEFTLLEITSGGAEVTHILPGTPTLAVVEERKSHVSRDVRPVKGMVNTYVIIYREAAKEEAA